MKNPFAALFGRLRPKKKETRPEGDEWSFAPEKPMPFGRDCNWLAIRCDDPLSVVREIGFQIDRIAGWDEGLSGATEEGGGKVFVSPVVKGYVLVVGVNEIDDPSLLRSISESFADAQYFGTRRAVEYHAWMRAAAGKVSRAFAYLGERDEVTADLGDPTRAEVEAGLFDKGGMVRPPDEEDVLDIAAAWGVDPRFPGDDWPAGIGYLCRAME